MLSFNNGKNIDAKFESEVRATNEILNALCTIEGVNHTLKKQERQYAIAKLVLKKRLAWINAHNPDYRAEQVYPPFAEIEQMTLEAEQELGE